MSRFVDERVRMGVRRALGGAAVLAVFIPAVSAEASRLFSDPVRVIPRQDTPSLIAEIELPGVGHRLAVVTEERNIELVDPSAADPWAVTAVIDGDGTDYFGSSSTDLQVADINGDGYEDLVLESGLVYIVPGIEDGTWGPVFAWDMGQRSADITLTDVNGDGHLDLLAPHEGQRLFDFRAGRGDFRFGVLTPGPAASDELVGVADLNGDGRLDFLRFDNTTDRLVLYSDDGMGGYRRELTTPIEREAGRFPNFNYQQFLGLGHLDDDDRLDLVLSRDRVDDNNRDYLEVWLGLGGGQFKPATTGVPRDDYGEHWLQDADGNGRDDLVFHDNGNLAVYHTAADGSFDPVIRRLSTTGFGRPCFRDVDRDGRTDILVTGAGSLRVLTQEDVDRYPTLEPITVPYIRRSVMAADFTGDGIPDLVGIGFDARGTEGAFRLVGRGDGTFDEPIWIPTANTRSFHLTDADGDSDVDLFLIHDDGALNSRVSQWFVNDGRGEFTAGDPHPEVVSLDRDGRFMDLDGDGRDELVSVESNYWTSSRDSTFISIYRLPPDGPINLATTVRVEGVSFGAEPVDSDADGQTDLLISFRYRTSQLRVLRGLGGLAFEAGPPIPLAEYPTGVLSGDWLETPGVELFLADAGGASILSWNGVGGLVEQHRIRDAGLRQLRRLPDMNGDGRPDILAIGNIYSSNSTTVLLTDPLTGVGEPIPLASRSDGETILIADMNRDGQPDLLRQVGPRTLRLSPGIPQDSEPLVTLDGAVEDWTVSLEWTNSGAGPLELWRRGPLPAPAEVRLGTVPSASPAEPYRDTSIRAAGRYGYRLVRRDDDGHGQTLGAVEVEIQPDPGPLRLLRVAASPGPAPFRFAFEARRPGPARLEIFRVDGRRARAIDLGVIGAVRGDVEWDGRGDDGRPVGAGIYFARFAGTANALRVVLVR